jgi:diguanylate cyclase (GGDEF)-like protein
LSKAKRAMVVASPMFASYAQLAASLLKNLNGLCLLDAQFRPLGQSAELDPGPIATWLRTLQRNQADAWTSAGVTHRRGQCLSAIAVRQSDGTLLGVFCVTQSLTHPAREASRHAAEVAKVLKPLLDCMHRELAAALPTRSRVQALTERTAELEWLFQVTENLKGATDDRRLLQELLVASTQRVDSALGVLCVPEKRLCIEHARDPAAAAALRGVWNQTQEHLITWAQRQNRPLVLNGAGRNHKKLSSCKILSVPVVRDTGRVLGVMAFFNPVTAADFATRHVFLARHLGRRTASLVEAQYDLMTGLYTRGGVEQMYVGWADETGADRSIIYVDVDHMHVVNELHGFEVGNELIVRIADLLTPPLLPKDALAARMSGDRFAILLRESTPTEAASIAQQIQRAAAGLRLGPAQNAMDVSISCGIAALTPMPQALDRAIAAAELACKTAKSRGRNRIELYACDDSSMMRRHADAVAVGELRSALKADRLMLYAQRIAPLQNPTLPGGYEILLRLKNEDGTVDAPGTLIMAAQRYQLLPTIDRWVIQRALQTLAPYRAMLRSRRVSISINVSGQSIGDETFVQHFKEQLSAANLPAGCLTVEITEQAAVTNLARANELIRQLSTLGCRFALDDFGTGMNSLTALKNLQIARVKIDGSFVRDILTDRNSLATVRAIVELASGLSMDTVAEYVESKAIAKEVRRLGVDYAQGYAFGKPEPLEKILDDMSKDESLRLHRLFLEM